MWRSLLVVGSLCSIVVGQLREAEACACCDAMTTRTPVGWTEAGGAVLIELYTDVACTPTHVLEIWRVGDTRPSGCYDLSRDPRSRVACTDGDTGTGNPRMRNNPTGKVAHPHRKSFPRAPVKLAPAKLRMTDREVPPSPGADPDDHDQRRVTVEVVDAAGTWKRVWTGTIETRSAPVVSVWPNARGDRAFLLVTYTRPGTGNEEVDLHWVGLPKP